MICPIRSRQLWRTSCDTPNEMWRYIYRNPDAKKFILSKQRLLTTVVVFKIFAYSGSRREMFVFSIIDRIIQHCVTFVVLPYRLYVQLLFSVPSEENNVRIRTESIRNRILKGLIKQETVILRKCYDEQSDTLHLVCIGIVLLSFSAGIIRWNAT